MMINQKELQRIVEMGIEADRRHAAKATATTIKPRFVTLREWAQSTFSKVPHNNTLLRWVGEGRIQPQPEKIGRIWRVKPSAVYRSD